MNILSYLKRVLLLVIFTSFAVAAFAAPPTLINAESGFQQSAEGAWEFGCYNEDPGVDPDQNEFLIFRGSTVEGRGLEYTSTDGTCSGGTSTTFSDTGDVVVAGEFPTLGWGDVGSPSPPPPRQDSSGPLNPAPIATVLEFVLPSGEIESGHYYMDDTAEPWCLWRHSGEDGAPSGYMSPEEPLCKVDIVIKPLPQCDIQLNQALFVNGDTITADVFRFANPADEPVALEVKIWLELQGVPPISVFNEGSDGGYLLPAGTDVDVGPLQIFAVTAAWPRGNYEFSCRMLDPITGERLAEDRNFFDIQ